MPNFDYCHVHYSSNEKQQDTNYRKGKRIAQSIDQKSKDDCLNRRRIRQFCGEKVVLLPKVIPPKPIYPTEKCIIVEDYIIVLVDGIFHQPWQVISSDWADAFDIFPKISRRMSQLPGTFSSWDDYVAALFLAIDEPIKQTRHPLWVINIIKDAEMWFTAESNFPDKRKKRHDLKSATVSNKV